MKSTLAERVKEAMNGPPKVTGKALAQACGLSEASVSDWRSGKTKTIEAGHLLCAAEYLKVRPKWLADGVGSKRESGPEAHEVREPVVQYLPKAKPDKLTEELLSLFSQLDKAGKLEHLGYLRGFVAGRRPHKDGPASAVAG